jgi:hypothetical protein
MAYLDVLSCQSPRKTGKLLTSLVRVAGNARVIWNMCLQNTSTDGYQNIYKLRQKYLGGLPVLAVGRGTSPTLIFLVGVMFDLHLQFYEKLGRWSDLFQGDSW